ncbi:hypothetical protein DTO164E3_1269 [Paecilomyces variotii]|nr:hypothetical protein DTO164E3_1269 [Paecilomyces variotii]
MSGLEAIGVAASIIQVADLGTKLSVRLFSLYRRFKDADQALRDLSSDVALTCAILRELGESIEKDEQSKLCSEEAFCTLKSILGQCREVLEQIQNMIDYRNNPQKTPLQRVTEKFRNVLLEPKLDPLKVNLERLKSTMLLLLNVIMYAGQIRSKHVPTLLEEQRALLESLLEEKRSNERGPDQFVFIGLSQVISPESASSKIHSQNDGDPNSMDGPDEVRQYNVLIKRMLQEIELCKSKLESSRHSRIKDGVLNIHSGEIVRFQLEYGHTALQNFDHSLFADRSTKPSDLKTSATYIPASTMPQPRYLDNNIFKKKPPNEPLQHDTTGPSAPALPASPDDRPHQSIRNSKFAFHESETEEQVTSNSRANERPPDSLSTIDHNLSTDGREDRAPVSREFFPRKPISSHNPHHNPYRPRLKRQISSESNISSDSSDDGVQDVPADVLSSLDLSVAERTTASSSVKPISPHTSDTVATPSRLRSDHDIDHDVDLAPQYRWSNIQAPEDLVDGEQRRIEIPPPPPVGAAGGTPAKTRLPPPPASSLWRITPPSEIWLPPPPPGPGPPPGAGFPPGALFPPGAGLPPPPPVDAAAGATADITRTKRVRCGRPVEVDAETALSPKLPGDKSDKPQAKSKAARPSTPESTSPNDDSLPDNLVDLMLRWTNIERDELEGRSQKRYRDSKDQEAP